MILTILIVENKYACSFGCVGNNINEHRILEVGEYTFMEDQSASGRLNLMVCPDNVRNRILVLILHSNMLKLVKECANELKMLAKILLRVVL